ncbi:MAG: hypothetical protein ACRDYU_14615 [Actinomycetes bacterium]
MRTRLTAWTAIGVAMALMLTGCGGVEAKAWASDVCGSLKSVNSKMEKSAKSMTVNPGDMKATQKSMVTLLGVAETQSQRLASDVEKAGTPDVEGGEEDANRLVSQLEKAARTFGGAKEKLGKADAEDPQALALAFQSVQKDLAAQGSKVSDPTQALKSKELRTALKKDAACKSVRS